MSTSIMALCWPLQMPPTQKAVLVSLADNANDHGECWPSVARICERTCFSERAVHRAIAWLEEHKVIQTDRANGRSTRFVITPEAFQPPQMRHPRISGTPANAAPPPPQMRQEPPQMRHPTPANAAPRTVREPSRTVRGNRKAEASGVERPDDVNVQTWADWLALRRAKRAPVTLTVVNAAKAEAAKAGMSLNRFLEIWCARGSQGLQADWLKPNEREMPANGRAAPSGNSPAASRPL